MLQDMRLVYSHPDSGDETPGQKAARRLIEDDPKSYLALLERLERDFRAQNQEEIPSPVAEEMPDSSERIEDPTSERLIGEIDAWLERKRLAVLAKAEAIERGEKA